VTLSIFISRRRRRHRKVKKGKGLRPREGGSRKQANSVQDRRNSAIRARMWAGDVPQQPPAKPAPASTHRATPSANRSGHVENSPVFYKQRSARVGLDGDGQGGASLILDTISAI
jgi:hypothetical protein